VTAWRFVVRNRRDILASIPLVVVYVLAPVAAIIASYITGT
jgi:hypothetical protein